MNSKYLSQRLKLHCFRGLFAAIIVVAVMLPRGDAHAQCAAITIGDVIVDPPTFLSLGFSVPIIGGDSNYNAVVSVRYRQTGLSNWRQALPLLRVRPETISGESPPPGAHRPTPEQFAGSIMNLQAATSYDVEFNVVDPDGCNVVIPITTSTRAEPPINPAEANAISVNSISALRSAIAAASPGDVITLAAGTYVSDTTADSAILVDSKAGNVRNPIVIRGEDRNTTVIDGNGSREVIRTNKSDYIYIQDLTLRNAEYGVRISHHTTGVVIQGNIIHDVQIGIWAKNWTKRDLMICDNELRGPVVFPQVDGSTWDYEGIVVHGGGGVICHNTISGFGDAIGMSKAQEADSMPPHRSNDFYGNDVLWGGDDCFEFDYSERNNRAFRNRCTNTANGLSFQPVYGGPAYAFENVIYNMVKNSVIKPNNTPSGIIMYHNLFSLPWLNYASSAYNVDMRNNLFIGNAQEIVTDVSTRLLAGSENQRATIDYNGWSYDGRFRLGRGISSWPSLQRMKDDGLFGAHSLITGDIVFEDTSIPLRPAAGVFAQPLDSTLHVNSPAIDAGVVIPNINDGFTGNAPDIGPYERGKPAVQYGVRWELELGPRPNAPTDLNSN